jgi:hypothetical protein
MASQPLTVIASPAFGGAKQSGDSRKQSLQREALLLLVVLSPRTDGESTVDRHCEAAEGGRSNPETAEDHYPQGLALITSSSIN